MTQHTAIAPAPQRATNTITLSVGLIAIPLSVYSGTESTRVARKEFIEVDGQFIAVGRSPVRKDTGEVIDSADVLRMAEADSGAWVVLTDDEIADCTSPKGLAEVETFVPVKDMGAYLAEDVLQVRPKREKGRSNPAIEKAYAVLLAGMAKRKVCALVKVAMRGPARYALLTADGDLILVHTADQVRARIPAITVSYAKAEVDMVASLIDAIGIDTPVITDDTAPAVAAYVNQKADGVPVPAKVETPAISDDIMSTISASIDAAKARKGKSKVA
jgi:non-homologous end joining protein Ku